MKASQIVVIGNGFDLSCGLKTSYRSFIDYLKHQSQYRYLFTDDYRNQFDDLSHLLDYDSFMEIETSLNQKLEALSNQFWLQPMGTNLFLNFFALRSSNRRHDWYQIESIIKDPILTDIGQLPHHVFQLKSSPMASSFEESFFDMIHQLYDHDWDYLMPFLLNGIDLDDQREVIMKIFNSRLKQLKYQIKTHLFELESLFRLYLNQVENELYERDTLMRATALFQSLNINEMAYILNFNYTKTMQMIKDTLELDLLTINYVHGQQAPIFGIDYFEKTDENHRMYPSTAYELTKTVRRLLNEEVCEFNLPEQVGQILFFGHSLSPADYSYFQALFDKYDLYSSSLQLIFYETATDLNKRGYHHILEVKTDLVKRIYQLIQRYGATMDNEDHGRNLLHKLTLEGRLKIRVI